MIIDILPYDFYREVSKIFCQIFQNGFLQNVPHKKVWNFNWGTFVLIVKTKNLANNVCFFNDPKWLKAIFWSWYKLLLTKFFAYNKTTDSHEYFVKKIMKIRLKIKKVGYFFILILTTLYSKLRLTNGSNMKLFFVKNESKLFKCLLRSEKNIFSKILPKFL